MCTKCTKPKHIENCYLFEYQVSALTLKGFEPSTMHANMQIKPVINHIMTYIYAYICILVLKAVGAYVDRRSIRIFNSNSYYAYAYAG